MIKTLRLSLLIFGLLILSSCTKEKAEAIKVAAEQFRVDAVSALEQMNYLFKQDIAITQMSEENQLDFVNELLNDPDVVFSNELFDGIETVTRPNDEAAVRTDEKFDALKAQYFQFEKMFSSLDEGSYFAKDAVKEAEKHAINLTLQFINYAGLIDKGSFVFASKRKELLVKMRAAKKEDNPELQKELYRNISLEVLRLLEDEKKAREGAIRQCYKAAESGKTVTELIRHYGDMNVGDILSAIKEGLNFAGEITNGNQQISDLTMKFEGFAQNIKADPYYDDLINKDIITTSAR